MPVVDDPHRCFRLARQFDRGNCLHAEARLRSEAAADVIGDDANLVVFELVALGDLLLEVKHLLGRGVQGQPVAVEACHGGVRLETCMLLRSGAERRLDQQGVVGLARLIDPVAGLLGARREHRGRSADVLLPRCRPAGGFRDIAGPLAARLVEHHWRVVLTAGVEPDHRGQAFAGQLDRRERGKRRLAVFRRDRRDRLANICLLYTSAPR